jgi:SEC-C motif-containing protein
MAASQGGPNDKTGKVEFKASYIQEGERATHHELSRFRRSGGKWYYVDGSILEALG